MRSAMKLRGTSFPAGPAGSLQGAAAPAAVAAGPDLAAALSAELALGLRASYRHLATLQLAAGSPGRAAAMLRAAESLAVPG